MITKLDNTNNFGLWFNKINEIIENSNNSINLENEFSDIIQQSKDNGQIGNNLDVPLSRDCNDYIKNGVYYLNGIIENSPSNDTPVVLYCASSVDGYITQLCICNTTKSKLYIRSKTKNNLWSNWIELSNVKDNENKFVLKTGDIISGSLQIQENLNVDKIFNGNTLNISNKISLTDKTSSLDISNNPTNYSLTVNKDNILTVNKDDGKSFFYGTSNFTDNLTSNALVQDYLISDNTKASSSYAVNELYNTIDRDFVKKDGSEFNGIVSFNKPIRIGEECQIYAIKDLEFIPVLDTSFISKSSSSNLYIDKNNEPVYENIPSTIGLRTRTGTTDTETGELVYELGCIEICDDSISLRTRKRNISLDVPVEEAPNTALKLDASTFVPNNDNTVSVGSPALKFSHIYINSDTINTSDKNSKSEIKNIDPKLLSQWKNINWKQFKFKDSIKDKGKDARLHTGLIAQDIQSSIKGIDINKYGFFCYDKWDDQYEIQKHIDKNGEEYIDKKLIKPSGQQYSLRYQEIQAIENCYLRNEIEKLHKEINELKKEIKSLKK